MPLTPEAARRKDASTTGAPVKFQHRHFAFIAQTVAGFDPFPETYTEDETNVIRREMARTFSRALASTNPNFDRARFLAACGVAE